MCAASRPSSIPAIWISPGTTASRSWPVTSPKATRKGAWSAAWGTSKRNFLNGLELPDFAALNPAVRVWLETVANVRLHRETQRRPVDLWAEERAHLQPVNPRPFDVGRVLAVRANRQFRVTFEANRYSVPARFAGAQVTLKAYPEHLCVYHDAGTDRPPCPLLRAPPGSRRPGSRQGAGGATPPCPGRPRPPALPRPVAAGGEVPHRLAGAARQCPVACAQDRGPGGHPRRGGGRPGPGRCPGVRGLQQRVHRPSDPGAGPPTAAAQPAGLAAPPGCPGPGTAAAGPLALSGRAGG